MSVTETSHRTLASRPRSSESRRLTSSMRPSRWRTAAVPDQPLCGTALLDERRFSQHSSKDGRTDGGGPAHHVLGAVADQPLGGRVHPTTVPALVDHRYRGIGYVPGLRGLNEFGLFSGCHRGLSLQACDAGKSRSSCHSACNQPEGCLRALKQVLLGHGLLVQVLADPLSSPSDHCGRELLENRPPPPRRPVFETMH